MKTILTSLLFAASSLAAALPPPENAPKLVLQVRAPNSPIDGSLLELPGRDGVVVIGAEADRRDPTKATIFYPLNKAAADPAQQQGSSTFSLCSNVRDEYPCTHEIAIVGDPGTNRWNLQEATSPTGATFAGKSASWAGFGIDNGELIYRFDDGVPRRWIAFPNPDGTYAIQIYDGVTLPAPENYQNVTVAAAQAPAQAPAA